MVTGPGFAFAVPAGWQVRRAQGSVTAVSGVQLVEVATFPLQKRYDAKLFDAVATELNARMSTLARQTGGKVVPGDPVDDTMNPQVQAPAQDAGTADTLQIQTIDLPGANIQNGDLMLLRIMRMAGAGAEFADDDLAQNALLHAVEVRYPAVS